MEKNMGVLGEARRLYALGLAVHWLLPNSKRPVKAGWTSGKRQTWEELKREYRKGYNVGVRLGEASRLKNGYLAVLDIDVKSREPRHRREAEAAAKEILRRLKRIGPVVESGRGGGSAHYYLATKEPFPSFKAVSSDETVKVYMPSETRLSKRDKLNLTMEEIRTGMRVRAAWELGLMSEGTQVVVPPSIHPDTKKTYRWAKPLTERLPVLTLDGLIPKKRLAESISLEADFYDPPRVKKESVTLTDFAPVTVELDWLPVSERILTGILTGKGVLDRSAFLLPAASALVSAGLNQNEVLSVLTEPNTFLGECAYEHAKTRSRLRAADWLYRYTVCKIFRERSVGDAFSSPPLKPVKLSKEEVEAQTEEIEEDRNWRSDLDKTKDGKPRSTLKNLDLILTNRVAPKLFVEDTFANRIYYGETVPWADNSSGSYISDIDMILVKRWLADSEGIEPNTNAILEATSLLAHRVRVHPVKRYLESLTWDGTPRIGTWLKTYCNGQGDEPYLTEVSRLFLLAMVKRIYQPGCQWDYLLVLEGNQGEGKSTIARTIAGDAWFMDNLPDLKDKDAILNLQGKWVIELGELAGVKRTDFNLVKAYLSRRTDTVRPHYGRIKADVPRQNVFIGTVNEGQYLLDPTGNRRYWPIRVGECDVSALREVRDQLFAEALYVYRNEDPVLMLSRVAEVQARMAQDNRRVHDDSTEMRDALEAYLASPEGKNFPYDKFSVRKDLLLGVNAPWAHWNGKSGGFFNVAAQVLTNMGFVRTTGHGKARFWMRPKR